MTQKIGIIGAGSIAQAFAKRATRSGLTVVLSNSRGPDSLSGIVKSIGQGASAGTVEEAAAADIIVISVPWSKIPAALAKVKDWSGKIVIDTNNPIEAPAFKMFDLGGKTSSEVLAAMMPGARLVKAMNTLRPDQLESDPREPGGKRVIFMSGDNDAAKTTVRAILEKTGLAVIDMGSLAHGGIQHQFPGGPLAGQNLVRYG